MAAKNSCTFGLRITGCVATLSAALALATARQSIHFSNVNDSIQMLMVLLASSNSAALSAICLERNGNFHAGWRGICGLAPQYCNHIIGAITASYLGFVIYMILLLFAINNLLNPLLVQ
ncbi:casp-like protein 1c1 [Quercus suber]|uniref:CASP-like protein n=1 Tax=Quercus suber TaxID=58331 RepID=A0AAW0M075_QUESU